MTGDQDVPVVGDEVGGADRDLSHQRKARVLRGLSALISLKMFTNTGTITATTTIITTSANPKTTAG